MEVTITKFLDDIIKAIEKKEKKSKLPKIITDHSQKLLFELFNMICGKLKKQLNERKTMQNNCEILIDEINLNLNNGRSLIPIFWKTIRLSNAIKSGEKVSKSHLTKCENFQYLLRSRYKAGKPVITQRTIFNYVQSGYDDKTRQTKESIYAATYILLDYFVSNENYREYFCENMKQLLIQVYDIDWHERNLRNPFNFRQFGIKKEQDRENINALIFLMCENKLKLFTREQEITNTQNQEDKFEFDLTLKLGSKFGKCFDEKKLFSVVSLCDEKAVNDNQEYIKSLYSCLMEEDFTFLKYECCVSWISYKYLNPDIQSDSDEYRAFLLYYLLHKLPWTDYLMEKHIDFKVGFDYFDYCLQYFEYIETNPNLVHEITKGLNKPTDSSEDFLETIKQLLNLEQAIASSYEFIRYLEEQQIKKKGD